MQGTKRKGYEDDREAAFIFIKYMVLPPFLVMLASLIWMHISPSKSFDPNNVSVENADPGQELARTMTRSGRSQQENGAPFR